MAITGLMSDPSGSHGLLLIALILVYIAAYASSIACLTWVILSEIFPNRIRGKAMSVANLSLWSANSVLLLTFPVIQEHFGLAAPFAVYAGVCVVIVLFVWKFIPETKGKSLEEIGIELVGLPPKEGAIIRSQSPVQSAQLPCLMELQCKPDFEAAMKRVSAWFAHELLDRPPVRFSEHNADFAGSRARAGRAWPDLKSRWFDAEFQVDFFLESIRGRRFYGETFPVFWPNLGPNVYAAFHGAELDYGEVTSWIRHCVHDWADMEKLKFSRDNVYFRKIEELTRVGLEKSAGRFLVGYTDLHGSLDCAADWRDPQRLCIDLIDCPGKVHELVAWQTKTFWRFTTTTTRC